MLLENKIQTTMEIAKDFLKFLDLGLTFNKESKHISVGILAKATNNVAYVLPKNCFPRNNIENIPKSVGNL